jgi:hypothetical protein
MHVLIDMQKPVEVEYTKRLDTEGEEQVVLDFDSTYRLLEAWIGLDPSRRNYRYGGTEDDNHPDPIILAYVGTEAFPTLEVGDVDPFTTEGFDTLNAYSLAALEEALPAGCLMYGPAIGEEEL